jgi:GT2 family glycosyltransferase
VRSGPIVSVIIVNYNGLAFIDRTLDSLRHQTRLPDEIIVVDNASTDGSAAMIAARYPHVQLIRSPVNTGFTGGVNLGARHATGDMLALLNSDARADPAWLELLINDLLQHEQCAVSQGKILTADAPQTIEQAGALFNNIANYWGRGYRDRDQGQYEQSCEVPGVTACAMLVRREALGASDMFDESLFMYGEELDLTIRLRIAGWSIRYVAGAPVVHAGMQSINASDAQPRLFQMFYSNRNRVAIVARYYPLTVFLTSFPWMALSLAYADWVLLTRGGPRRLLQAVRSQGHFFLRGLARRSASVRSDAEAWLPWMTRHGLLDILRQKRRMN